MTELRRVTRALLSVSDKTGLDRFRARARGRRRRAGLDRRHPQGAERRRAQGARRVRAHRLSRDDGRPGQDAASQRARRPAGDPRQHGARGGDAGARHPRRSICWWSTSIRSRRPSRRAPTSTTCIENIDIGGPAMIRAAAKNHADVAVVVDAGRLRRGAGRARGARRRDDAGVAPEARRQGLCAHRRLRRGDLQLVRAARSAEPAPAYRAFGGQLAEALRYGENPHQAAAFYRTPRHAPRRRDRAAGAGQAALLQQHQRHRRGLRMRRRVRLRRAPPPASSSSTPIRAASPKARACSTPTARRWPAIRSRRSAASSRSTARSTPRRRAPSPRSSPRSSSRPTRARRRSRSSARRRICGCCSPAACPIRAPAG